MSPKIVDKQTRRIEITQAAAKVFARKGFKGASVDDIALAAGVSKGTVYGYFENKEALFYATFLAFQGELMQECEAVIAAQTSAGARLSACLVHIMGSLQQNIQMFPLTLEFWAAASSGSGREHLGAVMEKMYAEFRSMTAALIEAGKTSGEFRTDVDADAVAAWLVGGLDGLMLQYWFDKTLAVRDWTDNFLQQILRSMAADN